MEEEDQVVKQVERQMAQLQREHVANTAALEKKLKWYAENQQIIGQNNELVKEQTDTIVKLKRRLASYEGVQASGFEANPKHLNQKMAKRIKELEGEVATRCASRSCCAAPVAYYHHQHRQTHQPLRTS